MSNTKKPTNVRLIASPSSWIEGEAVRQLEKTAALPGMRLAVGLPDIHPGKGHPVGAAFVSQGVLYPHLVGNDVGCGIGLWQSDLKRKKMKIERWVKKLNRLEGPWDGDAEEWLADFEIPLQGMEYALGTIGGGNHFAELQVIETIDHPDAFEQAGLNRDRVFLLVHSGSRGLGETLLRSHTSVYGTKGLEQGTEEAEKYVDRSGHALRWAKANRALIAHRFFEAIGTAGESILDVVHNSLTPQMFDTSSCWLHRKGAATSDQGPVVVAGSRGAFSYLVRPIGDQTDNLQSIAHGAGRKWNRSDSLARLKPRYKPEALTKTDLGGRVICEDKGLLYEEAPQAYKNIQTIIEDLQAAGLIEVIATLRPVITYKTKRI